MNKYHRATKTTNVLISFLTTDISHSKVLCAQKSRWTSTQSSSITFFNFSGRFDWKIVYETNLYAQQKNAPNFRPTYAAEFRAYLGNLFLMGKTQLANYRCFWSEKPELNYRPVADIMSRNRCGQLTHYFNLNNSTKNPPQTDLGHDKLHKVRPILENEEKISRAV